MNGNDNRDAIRADGLEQSTGASMKFGNKDDSRHARRERLRAKRQRRREVRGQKKRMRAVVRRLAPPGVKVRLEKRLPPDGVFAERVGYVRPPRLDRRLHVALPRFSMRQRRPGARRPRTQERTSSSQSSRDGPGEPDSDGEPPRHEQGSNGERSRPFPDRNRGTKQVAR